MKPSHEYAVLLTLSRDSIPGGTESFARALQRTVPNLRIVGREDVSSYQNALARHLVNDVETARNLGAWLENQPAEPALIFSSGLHGWAIPRVMRNIPTIGVLHGSFFRLADVAYPHWHPLYWRMKGIFSHFEKQSLSHAHVRMANSPLTQKNNQIDYHLDSRVVELPIDTKTFSPGSQKQARKKVGWNTDAKIVLFVGNSTYSKGWDIVEKMALRFPTAQFYCICYPSIPPTRPNIHILPPQSHEKLADYYRAADVLFFPSRYEGFGFVPLEALSCHCPVLASQVGILRDFMVEGLMTVKHDDESFAFALQQILESPPSVSAYAQIKKRFSFTSFSRGVNAVIHDAQIRAEKSK